MDRLIEEISDFLNIPHLEPNQAVQDGSFQIAPISSNGVRGNGMFQNLRDYVSVNLFYTDKKEMVHDVKSLVYHLQELQYICSAPDYTYEINGGIWRANINLEV